MFRFFENLLEPFPENRHDAPPSNVAAFCWHYVKDAKSLLLIIFILTAVIGVAEVLLFGFLGNIVDWLGSSSPETFLQEEGEKLFWMAVLTLVGLPALSILHAMIMHQSLIGNLPMSARWRMHQHLLGQSMSFFSDEFAGRISTKLMQSSLAVRDATIKFVDVFTYVIIYFLTTVVLVLAMDARLAIPIIIWLLIYFSFVAYFVPRLRNISARQADARSVMTGRIVDSYTNISTVKLFAHAGREAAYARDAMDRFLQTVHPQMRLVSLFEAAVALNNHVLVGAVAGLGIYFWMAGDVTVGAVATATALALRFNGMSHWIMWEVSALFENIGTAFDGMSMLSKPKLVVDQAGARAMARARGKIDFENVRFHYGKESGVINDLSLMIEPGEKIGLVGRSGSGKSTLLNILLRFYDLDAGRICIDGEDISGVSQESLRANIGVVAQDTPLLHRSIRENIAYGRPDASDEAIREAARRANALEFIENLEDQKGRRGLDAHVGERGVRLSGGQRQRIAIARVFLKDAPILVLDEATSALDSEVELAIQENLFELMKGKTVIAIAHRLSTIAQLDRLVVIDSGQIIEQGPHEELVKAGGLYAFLWARQSGGFITESRFKNDDDGGPVESGFPQAST